MSVMNKITKARAGLVLDQPFFGVLTLKLRIKEDPTCETAWTDGTSLGFNPEYIEGLSLPQCKGLLAHEVMHCALAHHVRRGARQSKRWNIAGDYVINALLVSCGFELPKGGLINPAFKDQTTEHVYATLPESKDEDQSGSDPGGCGEVRDAPDGSESGKTEAENDWKVTTAQAARVAKSMGNLPDDLERLVGDLLASKVDWREVLRRFISQAAKNDYSWSRPNRRHIAQGLYLPSLYSEAMGELVVAVDTSGSIGQEELDQFASELTSIAEDTEPKAIHVVYCDTSVAHTEQFTKEDLPLQLAAKGGGGTDFRPPFAWVEEQQIQPVCLVYLTDMYCSDFPQEPNYPVLWISTSDQTNAPFGEVIRM